MAIGSPEFAIPPEGGIFVFCALPYTPGSSSTLRLSFTFTFINTPSQPGRPKGLADFYVNPDREIGETN